MPAKKSPKIATDHVSTEKPVADLSDEKIALKLKDLIDRVVEKSGAKKKDVRPVVDATLAVLGEALAAGESLFLPPLGRLRVNRTKELATGDVLILKLKRRGEEKAVSKVRQERLADKEE